MDFGTGRTALLLSGRSGGGLLVERLVAVEAVLLFPRGELPDRCCCCCCCVDDGVFEEEVGPRGEFPDFCCCCVVVVDGPADCDIPRGEIEADLCCCAGWFAVEPAELDMPRGDGDWLDPLVGLRVDPVVVVLVPAVLDMPRGE